MESKNIALEIVRLYDSFTQAKTKQLALLDEITPEEMTNLNSRGKLDAMIYATTYLNALERYFPKEANELRELNAKQQVENLKQNIGNTIEVHITPYFGSDAHKLTYQLKGIQPFEFIEGNPFSYPFVDMRGGICAIQSLEGKTLFVNPQLFNPEKVNGLNRPESFKKEEDHARAYDKFLRASFGEVNIETTRPYLKEGKFALGI